MSIKMKIIVLKLKTLINLFAMRISSKKKTIKILIINTIFDFGESIKKKRAFVFEIGIYNEKIEKKI
jgi:hypothetical protein